eukprot:1497154-Pyramimonas_sp.AAC.1
MRRAKARMGRREGGEEEEKEEEVEEERRKETRGTVSSKRGPNTTGWVGQKGMTRKLPLESM